VLIAVHHLTSSIKYWFKKKRIFLDDGCEGLIREVLRFLVVRQEMGVDGGQSAQGLGDARGGLAPCVIAVEQEKDGWSLGEPLDLVLEELGAKKRDRIGKACLRKAHGGPWAFDRNNSPVPEGLGTVGIVEDVGLGEVFGEAPFAEAGDLIGKEEACAVAEGTALDVVKAHGYGVS